MNAKTVALCCAVCLVCGVYLGFGAAGCCSGRDPAGTAEYETRSAELEGSIRDVADGVGKLDEQVQEIGERTERHIADVGELRDGYSRIKGESGGIAGAAGRIEDGIRRIEEILSEAEAEDGVLESDCGCGADSGGGRDRQAHDAELGGQ